MYRRSVRCKVGITLHSPPACVTIKFGARRSGDKKRGRDGTKYSRFHKRNYLSHHLAAIVSAVVLTDAPDYVPVD